MAKLTYEDKINLYNKTYPINNRKDKNFSYYYDAIHKNDGIIYNFLISLIITNINVYEIFNFINKNKLGIFQINTP